MPTGALIAGAQLVLYDSENTEIDRWKSGREPHVINKLKAGTYRLTEEKAPDGYQLADPLFLPWKRKRTCRRL